MKDSNGWLYFHPKKEPVAWIGILIIILQIIVGLVTHNLDTSLFSSLITAVGAAGIRQTVWSPVNHNSMINQIAQSLLASRVVSQTSNTGGTITENNVEYKAAAPSDFPDGDQLDSVSEETAVMANASEAGSD